MAAKPRTFKGPKGTRDVYPEDMLRRRYIVQTWRDTSIRHGFEEIEGPTFEESELYAVKSGDGILGELFQAFSGKSPEEVASVQETGRAPFALRPEFTPTLARMYAARARQLGKPTRWFMAGPFFRAERPQRGRLREFLQWNCDVLGLPGDSNQSSAPTCDIECISCATSGLEALGLSSTDAHARVNVRTIIEDILLAVGVNRKNLENALALLDRRGKIKPTEFLEQFSNKLNGDINKFDSIIAGMIGAYRDAKPDVTYGTPHGSEAYSYQSMKGQAGSYMVDFNPIADRGIEAHRLGISDWFVPDPAIVRGLAYYTGTVFEVIAEGERAVAGGGRYDNLIELLGGPPTPAVGFAMGDVVLSLLLEDKNLMPEGADLLDAVSARPASARPEAFVIGANDEASDAMVRRLVADLRRGVESAAHLDKGGDRKPWDGDRYCSESGGVRPMHARASDKSTRNVKKLLGDANKQMARFAVVIHDTDTTPDRVQLKDLDRGLDLTPADVPGLPEHVAEFSVQPTSPVYVGKAIAALTK